LAALGFSVYCIDVVLYRKNESNFSYRIIIFALYVNFFNQKFCAPSLYSFRDIVDLFQKLNQFQVHCIEDLITPLIVIDFYFHRLLLCF